MSKTKAGYAHGIFNGSLVVPAVGSSDGPKAFRIGYSNIGQSGAFGNAYAIAPSFKSYKSCAWLGHGSVKRPSMPGMYR